MRVWRVSSSAESPVAAGFSINLLRLKPQRFTGYQELMVVADEWLRAAKQGWASLVNTASASVSLFIGEGGVQKNAAKRQYLLREEH